MEKILTIAIPTYNRRNQLIRLLKSIESQDCIDTYSILISDNCSNYSVTDALDEEFSGAFRDNIEVMRREVNGGGDYNISSLFAYAKTKLFWIIGDDDETLPKSIKIVIDNYKRYPDIPFFKYTMSSYKFSENIRLGNVDDLIKYNHKGFFEGGIYFVSNNVYNVELSKRFFSDCLFYGYCSISQIIPMMHCLVDSDDEVLLCKDQIVKFNAAEGDHWNYTKVVVSLGTVLDINWGNNHKDIKRLFKVFSSYFGLGKFLTENIRIQDKSYRNYTYWKGRNTVFKHHNGLLDLFALSCYWGERITHIKFITGLYQTVLNKQTDIQNKFREKAKTNATAAKCFYFLKKHIKLMK